MVTTMIDKTTTERSTRYRTLLTTFMVFTLLDTVTTGVGIEVGCVELNPLVTTWGVPIWAVFRMLLLGSMTVTFLVGYRLCSKHYQKGVWTLQLILLILDIFIVAVVASGLFAIVSTLLPG